MKELGNLTKVLIENTLYEEVKLLLESQYDLECSNQRDSNRLALRNRQYAIRLISEAIEGFSVEKNLDKEAVRSFLLMLIQRDVQKKSIFEKEYRLLEDILISDSNQEKEENTR